MGLLKKRYQWLTYSTEGPSCSFSVEYSFLSEEVSQGIGRQMHDILCCSSKNSVSNSPLEAISEALKFVLEFLGLEMLITGDEVASVINGALTEYCAQQFFDIIFRNCQGYPFLQSCFERRCTIVPVEDRSTIFSCWVSMQLPPDGLVLEKDLIEKIITTVRQNNVAILRVRVVDSCLHMEIPIADLISVIQKNQIPQPTKVDRLRFILPRHSSSQITAVLVGLIENENCWLMLELALKERGEQYSLDEKTWSKPGDKTELLQLRYELLAAIIALAHLFKTQPEQPDFLDIAFSLQRIDRALRCVKACFPNPNEAVLLPFLEFLSYFSDIFYLVEPSCILKYCCGLFYREESFANLSDSTLDLLLLELESRLRPRESTGASSAQFFSHHQPIGGGEERFRPPPIQEAARLEKQRRELKNVISSLSGLKL